MARSDYNSGGDGKIDDSGSGYLLQAIRIPAVAPLGQGTTLSQPGMSRLDREGWIKWVFSSPRQAKGQGKVERAIRRIKTPIRRMVDEDPKAWAKVVADAQFPFNTRRPVSATGMSPAELLLGYLPRQRALNLVEPRVADKLISMTESAIDELRELRLAKLDSLRQEAVTRQLDNYDLVRSHALNEEIK